MGKIEGEACWLHISDFHIKEKAEYGQKIVLESLVSSLPELLTRVKKPDFVVASGDIAFSGKKAEYSIATSLFDQLLDVLGLTRNELYVVPGNHDIDRNATEGLLRTIENQEGADRYFDQTKNSVHIEKALENFKAWYDEFFAGIRSFPINTTCFKLGSERVGDRIYEISGINTATFCKDDNDHGKLWIGRRCLDNLNSATTTSDETLRLAVMHHPIDWLNQEEAPNIRNSMEGAFDVVLRGHLHENTAKSTVSHDSNTIHVSAGACYQSRQWPNTAVFNVVSADSLLVLPIKYTDSPSEIWTIDTSMFSSSGHYCGEFPLRGLTKSTTDVSFPELQISSPSQPSIGLKVSSKIAEKSKEFCDTLFTSPDGKPIFFNPRLFDSPQSANLSDLENSVRVSVDEILQSDRSFLIESRSEYGGSTLCRFLEYRFLETGQTALRRDAGSLPNYQSKLRKEFASIPADDREILLIDLFDLDDHEKLLRELEGTGLFKRVIAIQTNRGYAPSAIQTLETLPFQFKHLFIWTVGREEIRQAAANIFDTVDQVTISGLVDKVYDDLLKLCIPLTPANIVMYLRVLASENNYHPINSVDILAKYLEASLRRPSDAYTSAFNTKNKLDFMSEFVAALYEDRIGTFDEKKWAGFVDKYCQTKLLEIDAGTLLSDFEEARIVVRWNGILYLKYGFYFTYFLGRFLVSRPTDLEAFISTEQYLVMRGVVDVVTGLSSDNSKLVEALTTRLDNLLDQFSEEFIKGDFDPLLNLKWDYPEEDEGEIWRAIEKEIEQGPRDPVEIDSIKTSLIAEARTADQETRFNRFSELEVLIFTMSGILSDALRNSDDVEARLKLAAYEAVIKVDLIVFQVGTILHKTIVEFDYFSWGGVTFIGFNRIRKTDFRDETAKEIHIVTTIANSVIRRASDDLGSGKLSRVFSAWGSVRTESGFLEIVNFGHILKAKGPKWDQNLRTIIEKTDPESFYLSAMLGRLTQDLDMEISTGKERQLSKNLIALIQTKRSVKKYIPSKKAIKRTLAGMEADAYFEKKN